METFIGFIILMIMAAAVLFPIGMFAFMSLGAVFGIGGRATGRAKRADRRYVQITERYYDFDED